MILPIKVSILSEEVVVKRQNVLCFLVADITRTEKKPLEIGIDNVPDSYYR